LAAAGAKCPAPWADRTDIDGEHPFVEDADGDRIMHHEDSVPEIETTAHIARYDPARVLAEVAAKRAILDEHSPPPPPKEEGKGWLGCFTCIGYVGEREPCTTVRLLAQPYAGRPDWREEWRA
jgi:hypothetical protein